MTTPFRPLTARQEDVANLLGRGFPNKVIAFRLGMKIRTVDTHIDAIAGLLPNPDELPARTLVMLWAAHRLWEVKRERAA